MLTTTREDSRARFPDSHYFCITEGGTRKVVYLFQQDVGYAGMHTAIPMCTESNDCSLAYPLDPELMQPEDLGTYTDFVGAPDNVGWYERFLCDCSERLSPLEMIKAIMLAKSEASRGGVDIDAIARHVVDESFDQDDVVALFQ